MPGAASPNSVTSLVRGDLFQPMADFQLANLALGKLDQEIPVQSVLKPKLHVQDETDIIRPTTGQSLLHCDSED